MKGDDVDSLKQDIAALRLYAEQLEAQASWDGMQTNYGLCVARANMGRRPTAKRPAVMDAGERN